MKPLTCGSDAAEVDLEVAAALGDLGANRDVESAMAVVVEDRLAVVDAIPPALDHRPHLALGAIEHGLDRGMGDRRAELREQRLQPPLADPGGADHRCEVAPELARMADVQDDHLEHVGAQAAFLVELERRDADALLPDLGGARVVGAVRRAADVALVRTVDRPEGEALAIEHRHEGGEVGQMIAAVVGVVEQVDVARPDPVAEGVVHRFCRPRQGADVDRHVLGLSDQPALGVGECGREVPARVDDLGVGGAEHRLAHLLGDRMQAVLDDRDRDRVDVLASGFGHGFSATARVGQGIGRTAIQPIAGASIMTIGTKPLPSWPDPM